jgi:hypothetical protein
MKRNKYISVHANLDLSGKKLKTIGELMYFRFRLINFQSQDSSIENILY